MTKKSADIGMGNAVRDTLGALIMLGALRLAEPVLFGGQSYADLTIHPYWIVIVIASAQGGLVTGLSTAALATLMMRWPARTPDTGLLSHYAEHALTPILWLLAAMVLGAYRQGQITRETALLAENDRLSDDNALLAGEIDRLDAAVARMELSATTATEPGHEAIEALAVLGRAGAADRASALARAAGLLTRRPGLVTIDGAQPVLISWGLPEGYAPAVPDVAAQDGKLSRPVAGYGHAARVEFAGGSVVVLAEDGRAAEDEHRTAAVLAQAFERAVRLSRPKPALAIKAVG